jgi:GNAT superfamily N-acetyltransferase
VDADDRSILFQHQHLITDRGFQLSDDLDGMICRRNLVVPFRSDLTIRTVTDEAGLNIAAWISEQNESALPLTRDHIIVQRRLRRYRREYADWNYRFVVAYLNGEPVGTARLTDEELPVIVGVATLPAARRRGVATAITTTLAAKAVRERGACALYVARGSEAQNIYRKVGFEPLYQSRTWYREYGQTSG